MTQYKNELTERQIALYRLFLKSREVVLGRDLICSLLGYGRDQEKCEPANSTAYRALRKDIDAIKWSNAQYTIVSVKDHGKLLGYTLGYKDDVDDLIDHYKTLGKKYLAMAYRLEKKGSNNGAMRITPNLTWAEVRAYIERMHD